MAFAWLHSESGKAVVIPIPATVQAAGAAAALEWLRAEKARRFISPGAGGQKPKPRKRRHREKAVARPNQGRREEPVTFGGGGKGRRHRPCTIPQPAPTTAGTPRPAAEGTGHIFAHAGRVVRGHCMARTAQPPGDCAAPPQCATAGQLFQEE